MADLPLRGGQTPPPKSAGSTGPAFDPIEGGPSTGRPVPPQRGRKRQRHKRRSRLPWVLLLLALGAAAWWLIPSAAEIQLSSASLAFDNVRVGRVGEAEEIVVTNLGERNLAISELRFVGEGETDYQVDGDDCLGRGLGETETCTLGVSFAPQARGLRQAALEIVAKAKNSPAALAVTGTAQAPRVGLAPTGLDFATAPVDGETATASLTVSNVGTLPLELGRVRILGDHAGDFSRNKRCPSTRLDPGEACTFSMTFAPKVAGDRRATLSIANDSPEGAAEVPLTGRGLWDGPVLAADPTSVEFGEQRVRTRSGATAIRLRNPIPGPVTISRVRVDGDEAFSVSGGNCDSATLSPGEGCRLNVLFAPEREERASATLIISAAESDEDVRISLRGLGVDPKLASETSELSFGSTRVGLESGSQSAIFHNSGSGTLRLARVDVRGAARSAFRIKRDDCSNKDLGPRQKCTVRVAFRPGREGGGTAELHAVPAGGLDALQVPMSGSGIVAGLTLDRGSLDFGRVYRTRTEDRRLTLTNAGSATLQIRGMRIEGEAESDYRLAGVGCRLDAGLGAGRTCIVSIRFAPTADGGRKATLVIDHNGPKSPARVAISGSGLPPRPVFRASEDRFRFGALPQGRASSIQTLTLSNPGAGWLDLRRIAIRGDHAEDFEIVPGTCDGLAALAPGGTCTVGLRFTAKSAGRRRGYVLIEHGARGGPARISLEGEGAS